MKYSYDITTSLEFEDNEIFPRAYDLIHDYGCCSAFSALHEAFADYYGYFEADLFKADKETRLQIISDFREYVSIREKREASRLTKIEELKNQITELENQLKELEEEGLQ